MSIYGLHLAARTLTYLTRKSVILQNNLANQSTDGFKLDYAFGTADPSGVPTLNRSIKLSQGAFVDTGNPLDIALDGPGFLVVQGSNGIRLTRNGALHIDPTSHQLLDASGRPVLGENGPIVVDGDLVHVEQDGAVTVDGVVVDRLRLASVAVPAQLEKEGAHLLVPNGPLGPVEPSTLVRTGQLEESNVNGVDGIGDMIEVQRNFAMMTNAMRSMDDVLETVTSQVGRL